MKVLFYIVLSFVFTKGISQNIDNNRTFEAKRTTIEKLIYTDTDGALKEAQLVLNTANKSGSSIWIAKAQSTMALVKIYLTDFEEAKMYNKKSLVVHVLINSTSELAKNYFNLALVSERQSDYVGAIKYFLKTISFAEKSKDYILIQKSYRGISMSYLDQQHFDKALEFANKSLAYQKFKNDAVQKAYSLAAIAEVYRLKGDLLKANTYFKQSYDSFLASKDEHGMAWVLTNWSLCFEYDLIAFTEMALKAQNIWDKIAPENTMSIMNLGNIGYNYMIIADNDSVIASIKNKKLPNTKKTILNASEIYIRRGLYIAKKKKNRNAMLHLGDNLSSVLYIKKDYKTAYDELRESSSLGDSLYSQANKNKIASLESEKKLLVRDQKISRNKLTLANKEKQKWYFISGLVLLAIIGILLFYQSRNRRKNNEKLQQLNENLDHKNEALDQSNKVTARFFGILNHDLRRPVYNLIHFLHLQKDNPELLDAEMKKEMEKTTMTSAENLLQSMEDLLLWSKGQMENFKLQPTLVTINSLFEDTNAHFSSEEKVKIIFENPNNIEITTDENYLKTIIRNLTGNAIKALDNFVPYNDTDSRAALGMTPTIIWKAFQKDSHTFLSITDNGKGASDEQFKGLYDDKEVVGIKTGLGLHLIRDLAKAINCEVSVDSKLNKGTTFTLKLNS